MPQPGEQLPLGLYVHFPWCVRKCPYCDFNSHQLNGDLPELRYAEAILDDLDRDCERLNPTELTSVFLGGGTPSLFSPDVVEHLLSAITRRGLMSGQTEVTLEANPGTLDADRFSGFRQAGVNRISIGVQSFNDNFLQRLGRIHDAASALRAVERARDAGFDNLNIDLMFGLPGQTVAEGLADLEVGISLEPTHLSYYQLTIEPNTLFHRFPPNLPDEDCVANLYESGSNRLEAAGYRRYEVSAWARGDAICEHNLNYWQFGDYLGIGAGAHAKSTALDRCTVERVVKHKHPTTYLTALENHDYVMSTRVVSPEDRVFEFMLNALRLNGGVSWELFEDRTGLSRNVVDEVVSDASERGLLSPGTLIPTDLGERFLDDLVALFVPVSQATGD